ncbi:hypothetical protein MYP14_08350 [Rhodococcus pyridinivorans]|uniref:DUF6953 family protein n=1 Tax=Rhodococcus pyridinivorans TaxID=103816 RepID=UPI001FFE699D|nr:hypothetical protein [Rhodococcus pyridinivorans]UPK65312.1 hypothetical protein MYP14_08350 [Rhodococcus pyridinivorans]
MTVDDIAKYMIERIQEDRIWYQQEAVQEIEERFGSEWIYINDNGNPAISQKVTAKFRKLHGGTIGWERRERAWYVHEDQ